MNYHWDWGIFFEQSAEGGGTYLQTLINGLMWTLATALAAWIIALILGFTIGTLTTVSRRAVARLAQAYIEIFRNIPLLVQMFLWYFVVPELLPKAIGTWIKGYIYSSFLTAVVSLGCYSAARVAVQMAAGLRSLPRGQTLAALAQGLRPSQVYRHILLPQAFRIIVLPLTGEFIGVMKNSAVALTIGLMELTARTRAMSELTFQTFEAFTLATVLYVLVDFVVLVIMHQVYRKTVLPGREQ